MRRDTGLLSQPLGVRRLELQLPCPGTLSARSLTGVAGETAPEGNGGEGRRRTSRREKVQRMEWRRAGK